MDWGKEARENGQADRHSEGGASAAAVLLQPQESGPDPIGSWQPQKRGKQLPSL